VGVVVRVQVLFEEERKLLLLGLKSLEQGMLRALIWARARLLLLTECFA
jgi:hypothetical protein